MVNIVNYDNVTVPRQEGYSPSSYLGYDVRTFLQFAVSIRGIKSKEGPGICDTENFSLFGPNQVIRAGTFTTSRGNTFSTRNSEFSLF